MDVNQKEGHDMIKKIFVVAITLSLLLSGMIVAVGGEATDESVGEGAEEKEDLIGENFDKEDNLYDNIGSLRESYFEDLRSMEIGSIFESQEDEFLTSEGEEKKSDIIDFAGGEGTEDDPYQIENWAHLDSVREVEDNAHFILNNDLDEETEGYTEHVAEGGELPKGTEMEDEIYLDLEEKKFEIYYPSIEEGSVNVYLEIYDGGEDESYWRKVDAEDYHVDYQGGRITLKETPEELYDLDPREGDDIWRVNASYILVDTIYRGWEPINFGRGGTFDGNGNEIKDLYIHRPDEDEVGLFGRSIYSSFKNIGLVELDIKCRSTGGGLIGRNLHGKVENSYSNGELRVKSTGGGLVGMNYKGTVENSYSKVDIIGDGRSLGGIVGFSAGGIIENAHAEGEINGGSFVGGLVGTDGGIIENSYATGQVSGEIYVGGIAGSTNLTVNSYFTGEVRGERYVGGLVGEGIVGDVINSHYNINEVLINDEDQVTLGGLFDEQYQDWIEDKNLNIEDYSYNLIPKDDHFEISSPKGLRDLLGFAGEGGYRFRLSNDINLRDNPGLYIPYLEAEFEGGGYSISNLYVNQSFGNDIGLFGHVHENGTVNNIKLHDVNIKGHLLVGGLAGSVNSQTTLSESYVSGEVKGNHYVGGLVGSSRGDIENSKTEGKISSDYSIVGGLVGQSRENISNSYSTARVDAKERVGGLVGSNWGTLSNSYAMGNVSGDERVGGLVGRNWGTVSNSYATGDVSGDETVGGLVGDNKFGGEVNNSYATGNIRGANGVGGLVGYSSTYEGTVIKNSYATGDIDGGNDTGGLIGWLRGGAIENTYSTGDISGEKNVGGLVGCVGTFAEKRGVHIGFDREAFVENSYSVGNVNGEDSENTGGLVGSVDLGNVNNSFWDTETSNMEESDGGTGKTTAEMKDVATYTDTDTEGLEEPWDFVGDPYDDESDEDIWDIDDNEEINDGYPFLRLEIDLEDEDPEDEDEETGWLPYMAVALIAIIVIVVVAILIGKRGKSKISQRDTNSEKPPFEEEQTDEYFEEKVEVSPDEERSVPQGRNEKEIDEEDGFEERRL